jgi:acyl carrier protein
MPDPIEKIVLDVVAEINEELQVETLKHPNGDTKLFEALDSMAVLDFILGVEESLQRKYGRYIQIANEKSMDPESTPFKTVESAVAFIRERVSDG